MAARTTSIQAIGISTLLILSSGCGVGERQGARKGTKRAHITWQAQGVRDYNMTVETLCPDDLPIPADVVVRDGKVVDAYIPGTTQRMTYYGSLGGPEVSDREVQDCYNTVEQLFEILEQVTSERPYPHEIQAEFDETYGYPTLINIDSSRWIEDDGYLYEITRFEVVQAPMTAQFNESK